MSFKLKLHYRSKGPLVTESRRVSARLLVQGADAASDPSDAVYDFRVILRTLSRTVYALLGVLDLLVWA